MEKTDVLLLDMGLRKHTTQLWHKNRLGLCCYEEIHEHKTEVSSFGFEEEKLESTGQK